MADVVRAFFQTPLRQAKPGAIAPAQYQGGPVQQPNGARAAIRSPQEVLGYVPGEARKLPSWPQIVGYFRELAGASDRVRFDDLGPATEGQPFVMLTITAPETLADLERYGEIQ